MAQLSRTTGTYTAHTSATAANVESDVNALFTGHNNHDSGTSKWTIVSALNATNCPGVFDNSTGTNDILQCKANGSTVFSVLQTGILHSTTNEAAITPATAGSTATSLDNRIAQIASQIKNGFSLTNWYDVITRKGQIIQTVDASTSTNTSQTGATYVDATNLSVTITPTVSGNKIRIRANVACLSSNLLNGKSAINLRIVRGASTVVREFLGCLGNGGGTTPASNVWGVVALTADDLPATTSATTYKIQFGAAVNTAGINATDFATTTSYISADEIGQ